MSDLPVAAGEQKEPEAKADAGAEDKNTDWYAKFQRKEVDYNSEIKCMSCGVTFANADLYRAHTDTDWHRENQERTMMGKPPLSDAEFRKLRGLPSLEEEMEAKALEEAKKQAEEAERSKKRAEEGLTEPSDDNAKQEIVNVCIVFNYREERWSHKYQVAKGLTILGLKQLMIKPSSPPDDAISFDLCQRLTRCNNLSIIDGPETFEFEYIGPEAGTKQLAKDKANKERQDEMAMQAKVREEERKRQSAERERIHQEEMGRLAKERAAKQAAQRESDKTCADDVGKDSTEPGYTIKQKHSDSTLTITMPKGRTVFDLKRAIVERVGRGQASKITLSNGSGRQLPDSIGLEKVAPTRQETFWLEGVDLSSSKMVSIKIFHAVPGGFKRSVSLTVPDTATYSELKTAACSKLGGKASDIRFVARVVNGAGVGTCADGMRLNGQREIGALGKLMENLPSDNVAAETANAQSAFTAVPNLTREQAFSLQEAFYERFVEAEFQLKLRGIREANAPNSARYRGETQKLRLAEQIQVLPKFGFEGSSKGLQVMLAAFAPFNEDSEFQARGTTLMFLSGVDMSAIPGAQDAASALDVEVEIDPDIPPSCFKVPPGETVAWVKEALSMADPTGATTVKSIKLCAASAPAVPLRDDLPITAFTRKLVLA